MARPRARATLVERCFDLTILVVFAPLIALAAAVIALAVYIDSPGPVIYRQRRIGRGGEPFEMLKFRKMRRDSAGHSLTVADDERFTPIGRFLSATRLDELPQVINVLRGEMRLVGPRPELECFVTQFAVQYSEILRVTPGITGRAQLEFLGEQDLLSGSDDPAEEYTSKLLPHKLGIDLHYAKHRSLVQDFRILARTATIPLALASRKLRSRSPAMARWVPTLAGALALVVAFALSSGNIA